MRPRSTAQAAALLGAVTMAACAHCAAGDAAIRWEPAITVASGAGHRGAWRQNESDFDYVDDATVALDRDGTVFVAWVDQQRKDVLLQVFDRDGKPQRSPPVDVSRSPRIFSWLPRVAVSPPDPNSVLVVWQEIVFSGGSHGGDIFVARSKDRGGTFETPTNLSNSVAGDGKGRVNRDYWHNGSLDIAIGLDGSVYVAWTEYEGRLWLARSGDGGTRFAPRVLIAGGSDAKPARAPALALAPDQTVYVAWTVGEDESADIRLARSSDGGRTFGEAMIVTKSAGYSDAPKLAVDARGTLHIVHAESAGGPFDRHEVVYTRSFDQGRSFESPRNLSKPDPAGIEAASFPSLSLDEQDTVCVLWELFPDRRRQPRGLGLACSADRGRTFAPPARVPGSADAQGAANGSHQGLLMRKLAMNPRGDVAVVNSGLLPGRHSRVWLMRGQLRQ